jgi:two-component system response regulator PilR (NtrC family)
VQRGLLLSNNQAQENASNVALVEANNQPLPEALAHLERAQIQHALEACRFNKTKAAAHLGITFRALRYKMDKLGLY